MLRKSLIFSVLLVVSCSYLSSWDDIGNSWVGSNISDIVELWGEPNSLKVHEDGVKVYKYHLNKLDPSCFHYWVVGENGIITDFYYEGYCSPIG